MEQDAVRGELFRPARKNVLPCGAYVCMYISPRRKQQLKFHSAAPFAFFNIAICPRPYHRTSCPGRELRPTCPQAPFAMAPEIAQYSVHPARLRMVACDLRQPAALLFGFVSVQLFEKKKGRKSSARPPINPPMLEGCVRESSAEANTWKTQAGARLCRRQTGPIMRATVRTISRKTLP